MDYTEKALRLDKINVTDYRLSNFGCLVATFLLTHFISLSVEDAKKTLECLVEASSAPSTGIILRENMHVGKEYFSEVYGKAMETGQTFMHGLTAEIYGDTQEIINAMRGMSNFMASTENRKRAVECIPELYNFFYDCYLAVAG